MLFNLLSSALLVTLVSAAPHEIEARQAAKVGATANEFVTGGCKPVVMLFARGTTEPGNMGSVCGPQTGTMLKASLGAGNVAVQGIDYPATVPTNFLPGGADPIGIMGMAAMINAVAAQCPDTAMMVVGYSQGAAVVHRAVENMPAATMAQIAGVVTFGDSQNVADNGQVPNFPPAKTMVICAAGDLVCKGTLTILPAHLSYGNRADDASAFMVQMASNAQASSGTAPATGAAGKAGGAAGKAGKAAAGAKSAAKGIASRAEKSVASPLA